MTVLFDRGVPSRDRV